MKINIGFVILLFAFMGCSGESSIKQNKSESAAPEQLYKEKCGGCHAIYEREKYPNEEWQSILIRMEKKAHLDEDQSKLILQYLTIRSDSTKKQK